MYGFYNTFLEHQQPGRTSDGQGGFRINWATVSTIRARVRPASGSDLKRGGKDSAKLTHVAYCEIDDQIRVSDRFYDSAIDRIYSILNIRQPGGIAHHLEIDCQEFKSGSD